MVMANVTATPERIGRLNTAALLSGDCSASRTASNVTSNDVTPAIVATAREARLLRRR